MEIGLREWLIVGAIIVIVLIVVDGWRRMRAQSNSLKIDIDEKLSDLGDETYNPELPHGTARVFKPKEKGDSAPAEPPNPADSVNANDHADLIDHNIGFNAQSTSKNTAPALDDHHQQGQVEQAQTEKNNSVEYAALPVEEADSLNSHQPEMAVDDFTHSAQVQTNEFSLFSADDSTTQDEIIKSELPQSIEQDVLLETEHQEDQQQAEAEAESSNSTFATNPARSVQNVAQAQGEETLEIDESVSVSSVVESITNVSETEGIEAESLDAESSAQENPQRIPADSENIYNTNIGFSALSDVPNTAPTSRSGAGESVNDETERNADTLSPAINVDQHLNEIRQDSASVSHDIARESELTENEFDHNDGFDEDAFEKEGIELETEVFHKGELEEPTTIINDMLSALSDSDQMRDITPIIKEESTVELQSELDSFSQQDSYLDSFQGTAVDDKFEQLLAERQTDGYIIAPSDDASDIEDASVVYDAYDPASFVHDHSHSNRVDSDTRPMEQSQGSDDIAPNTVPSEAAENVQNNAGDSVESVDEESTDQLTSGIDPRELVLSSMQNESLTSLDVDSQNVDDQGTETGNGISLAQTQEPTNNSDHFDSQSSDAGTDDSQNSINASVEDEIIQLKARLKELSPELVDDQDSAVTARIPTEQHVENLGETTAKDSDSNQASTAVNQSAISSSLDLPAFLVRDDAVVVNEPEQPVLVDASKYSAADEHLAQQNEESAVLDQRMKDQMTTVIDDDVELADLRAEVTKVPSDFELAVAEAAAEPDSVEENTTLGHDLPPFDELSDPLLDDLDEPLADSLLADDTDYSSDESHELNRPITELIKQNQTRPSNPQQFDIEHDLLESYTAIEEAVEHQNQHSIQQESLAFDTAGMHEEAKTDTEAAHLFSHDQQRGTSDSSDIEQKTPTSNNDMLGFTALEQGYIEDPLMDGLLDEAQESVKTTHEVVPQNSSTSNAVKATGVSEDDNSVLNVEMERASAVRKSIAGVKDPQSVLIVTVVAKDQPLDGDSLKHVVVACGMQFGEMNIFHRFEDGPNKGAVQFSMANAVNPGSFDIEQMDTSVTPGVSFFMSMDTPKDPKNALECMMGTAETVAKHLNGDLLDDNRSVIRPQTKEHYRERVREHEMDKLRRRAQ